MSRLLNRHPAVWLVVFTAAAAAGWWNGHRMTAATAAASSPPSAPQGGPLRQTTRPARVGVGVEPASPAAAWMTRVKQGAPADFPALYKELLTIFNTNDDEGEDENADESEKVAKSMDERIADEERQQAALQFLFAVWMDRDPKAALAFYFSPECTGWSPYDAGELAAEICPEQIAELLTGPDADNLTKEFTDWAYFSLAEHHPDIYLRIDPFDTQENHSDHWGRALKNLAATDPMAASRIWSARNYPADEKPDPSYLYTIINHWRTRDPAAARAWAESISHEFNRRTALHAWLSGAAQESPATALRLLSSFRLGEDAGFPSLDDTPVITAGGDARLEIAGRLAKQDFASALAVSQQIGDAYPPGGIGVDSVRQWMVCARISALPDNPDVLLEELGSMWQALTAPGEVPSWWNTTLNDCLPDKITAWSAENCLTALRLRAGGDPDDPVTAAFLQRAVLADPRATIDALPNLPEDLRTTAARSAFSALPPEEKELRVSLLRQLPPEDWNGDILTSLAGQEPDYAPVLAAFPPESNGRTRADFAAQWARLDPAAAGAWVASLPHQDQVLMEAGAVVRAWAAMDETEASAWVASLPHGAPRDDAAATLVAVIAPVDPNAAQAWALSIDDPAQRAISLTHVTNVLAAPAPVSPNPASPPPGRRRNLVLPDTAWVPPAPGPQPPRKSSP